jgi:hypothetical protein
MKKLWLLASKLLLPTENIGIVYAMEKAFEETEAYHGIITVVESNELRDTMTQAARDAECHSIPGDLYIHRISFRDSVGTALDYPIEYEDIKIIMNDGSKAIAMIESDKSIAEYIYMKRLVRQDETGIWTVIGYDKGDFE